MKRRQYAIKSVVVATAFVAITLAWAVDRYRMTGEIQRLNGELADQRTYGLYDQAFAEYEREMERAMAANDSP